MFTHILEKIEGVHVYPLASMILFVIAFGMVIAGVLFLSRSESEYLSRLPLENSGAKEGEN